MKRIFSFLLAAVLLVSAVPTALATNDYSQGTQVVYSANANEQYTVTVPATLAPGAAGDVVASGTWSSNRKLTVTADDDVTLTNSINAADQKVLDVTFAGIELTGSNTESVSDTKQVSVANITDAIFGTWSGTFNYNVALSDVTGGTETPVPVQVATFYTTLKDTSCHEYTTQHTASCYTGETATLSWEELQREENGTKYRYDASAISDTTISSYAFEFCSSLAAITIPESVTTIGYRAFHYCTALTSIIIPEGVTTIGGQAFRYCSSLTSIDLSNAKMTILGEDAFNYCTALTSIGPIGSGADLEIPESVTTIGDQAFRYCTSLTSIIIPEGVTTIGSEAFSECTSLASVTIPESVTTIREHAFNGCRSLTSITFEGTVAQWNAIRKEQLWGLGINKVICSDGELIMD